MSIFKLIPLFSTYIRFSFFICSIRYFFIGALFSYKNQIFSSSVTKVTTYSIYILFTRERESSKLTCYYTIWKKVYNKKEALRSRLTQLREKIDSGLWLLGDLWRPLVISFADLKKYHYYYWMCFPTFKLVGNISVTSTCQIENVNQYIDANDDKIGLYRCVGGTLFVDLNRWTK